MTCDVSFISLKQIFTKIASENINIDIICLIKPQFEAGKAIADKYKGIILNKKDGLMDPLIPLLLFNCFFCIFIIYNLVIWSFLS